ncbi:MAG: 2-C-methyl-D-erythritol 4-phosphate cytidylyltransferase [Bacteroidia bacterium]|nr:2-C-methyl-D-erythritol 4-phosphate cytidylyltransferase [Bacteroidia bacterium]
MRKLALIVAGGHGSRFGASVPKQFVLLNGKPILFYSLIAFSKVCDDIVVVISEDQHKDWKEICKKHNIDIPHRLAKGGDSRSESVINGLELFSEDGIVAVHDAARPLISDELIERSFDHAMKFGNAIPVLRISDSIRKINGLANQAVNRDEYRIVQTPQCFNLIELKEAYHNAQDLSQYSDDATLMEKQKIQLFLCEGDASNLKVTHAEDLTKASFFLTSGS